MKQILVILFSVIVIIILNLSCGSTEPEKTKFKHPRDMTWTADTLMPDPEAIQLVPENILVFAPNDIWLVCYSDVARRLLWHYDGNKWSHVESGGGKRYSDLAGYNKYDIWLGGYSGEKAHFTHKNGNNFIRNDFDITGQILDMTMDPQGNIWACGRNGIIMKYDKTKWIADTLKMNLKTQFLLRSICWSQNKIFISGSNYDNIQSRDVHYYFSGDLKKWKLIDSMIVNSTLSPIRWGSYGIYNVNNILFSFGLGGIWKLNINGWEKNYSIDGEIYGIYGVQNYLFASGGKQTILFFNGETWENIKNILRVSDPFFSFRTGWSDGTETFIAGYTNEGWPQKTIIWHGK